MNTSELALVFGAIFLSLLVLGGGVYFSYRYGYNSGYEDGLEEAVPMHGECGTCGESFAGGTIADAIARVSAHECPERDE